MMKHTQRWCQTPPSVTVRVRPSTSHSLQLRRGLRLKRDAQGPPGKSQPSQRPDDICYAKVPPTIVIQRQEMASFFRLFGKRRAPNEKQAIDRMKKAFDMKRSCLVTDDDLILDFLWMDCCCKMTDKVNGWVNVVVKMTKSLLTDSSFSP